MDRLTEQQHHLNMAAIRSKDAKPEMIVRRGLDSIVFTLNHIWRQDHDAKSVPYPKLEEGNIQMVAEYGIIER